MLAPLRGSDQSAVAGSKHHSVIDLKATNFSPILPPMIHERKSQHLIFIHGGAPQGHGVCRENNPSGLILFRSLHLLNKRQCRTPLEFDLVAKSL